MNPKYVLSLFLISMMAVTACQKKNSSEPAAAPAPTKSESPDGNLGADSDAPDTTETAPMPAAPEPVLAQPGNGPSSGSGNNNGNGNGTGTAGTENGAGSGTGTVPPSTTPPSAGAGAGPRLDVNLGGRPPQGGAGAAETPEEKLNFKIRVEKQETLVAVEKVKSDSAVVLFENAFRTEVKALYTIIDRAEGIYCKVEGSANVKTGDVLDLVGAEEPKPMEEDKTILEVQYKYMTADKKPFAIECTYKGDQGAPAIIANFKSVLSFSRADGTFPTEKELAEATDGKQVREKRRTFKILDLEKMKAAVAQGNMDKDQSIMDGKLLLLSKAQGLIENAKAEHACQVDKVKGTMKKDVAYHLADSKILGEDQQLRVALLAYTYEVDKKNSLILVCLMRMTTKDTEIFKTFEKILEFGVEKPKDP